MATEETFSEDLEKAVKVLLDGGIILYPTDTVWGIGCDATNPDAVERIYRLKRREDSKSMLALVDSEETLGKWVDNVSEVTRRLPDMGNAPTTVIYPSPHGLAPNLLASDGSVGIRITREPFSQSLCRRLGHPIVSTSANISGRPTPRIFSEIDQEVINGVDYVAETYRDKTEPGSPSRIYKIDESGEIVRLR